MPLTLRASVCAAVLLAIGTTSEVADKTLIDYFLPMPIQSSLVSNVWGASGAFPRDPQSGLDDITMARHWIAIWSGSPLQVNWCRFVADAACEQDWSRAILAGIGDAVPSTRGL